ncbi:DUF2740 domain-containing protein [Escherichia coli]|nr:DUF2740 domain-containing protein [Escherichia coli]
MSTSVFRGDYRFLSSFKQPGRFRAELEKVKLMQKEKGHE